MGNLTITNNDLGGVVLKDPVYDDELLTFAGVDTVLEGTLLARKAVADAITVAADGGNTGDGVVSAAAVVAGPDVPLVGAHNLECTAAGTGGTAVGANTPDGGNTGDGLVTAFAVSAGGTPEVGDFILKCTEKDTGGTGSGSAGFVGTGNGTASAVVAGDLVIEGDYLVTCKDASVSGSEIFGVITPNGGKLEDLTVGAAYLNEHFGLTLTDGSTDFIVGDVWTLTMTIAHGGKFKLTDPNGVDLVEDITLPGTTLGTVAVSSGGIDFTLNDGATDFAVDDFFTLAVTATELGGGTFNLYDPNGALLASGLVMAGGAGVGTVFEVAGMTFTITDGATDFIDGDKFSLTVVADGNLYPYVIAGLGGTQIPKYILTYDVTSTGAGDVSIRAMKSGQVIAERLIVHADGDASNITDAIRDQLRDFTIVSQAVQELNILDNQ